MRVKNHQKVVRLRMITDDYGRLNESEKQLLLYIMDNKSITRKTAVKLLNLQKTKVQGRSTYYTLAK
jgi:hypothetical protein